MPSDIRYTSFNQFNNWNTTVRFTGLTPKKKEFVKRVIGEGWGITRPEGISRIAAGRDAASRNYRIDSGGRAYLLKEGYPSTPLIRDLSNQFLIFCESQGAKVPHVRLTRHGWTYYGARCILSLYNCMDGENFDGSRKELREAATRLAQLDRILAKAPLIPSLIRAGFKREFHRPRDAKELFCAVRLCGARSRSEEEFLSAIGYLEDRAASLASERPPGLPMQPIHCNVHPHNVFFSKEGDLLAFLDFESIKHSQRAREVAFAMHRLARAYGEGTERKEDLGADIRDRAKDFLSAYDSENPLEDSEMRSLKPVLQDEAFSRVLTVLRNHYMRRDFTKDGHFQKRLTMLRETELFDFL